MFRRIKRLSCLLAIVMTATLLLGVSSAKSPTLESLQSLIDNGDYKTTLAQTQTFLEAHPGNREARFMRAVALAGLGRNDKAIQAFRKLAKAWPNRPEPANNLAALYARRGEYKKARKWLRKALNTRKVYAVAHKNLGDVYTALATMAYSQVLESGKKSTANKDIKLALVNHMYSARQNGLLLPKQKADSNAGSQEQKTVVKAPEPKPEPAYPPQDTSGSNTESDREPDTQQNTRPDNSRIIKAVNSWAKAWSQQDYDAYIGYYTKDFPNTGDSSRSDWLASRKVRVTQKASINVQVISPEVTRVDADTARVSFVQTYDSPSYSDKVRKWLLMRKTEDGWRIARETSTLLSRG